MNISNNSFHFNINKDAIFKAIEDPKHVIEIKVFPKNNSVVGFNRQEPDDPKQLKQFKVKLISIIREIDGSESFNAYFMAIGDDFFVQNFCITQLNLSAQTYDRLKLFKGEMSS